MVELSESVVDAIHKTFVSVDWDPVSDLLRRELGDNLPFMHDIQQPERFDRGRMAALKICEGDMSKLQTAIALGKADWRDLLMAAGFGQLNAHLDWYEATRRKPEKT